jgi:hypothetical protein
VMAGPTLSLERSSVALKFSTFDERPGLISDNGGK